MKHRLKGKALLASTVLLLTALLFAVPAHAGPKCEYGEAAWLKLDPLGQIHYSFLDGAVDEGVQFLL